MPLVVALLFVLLILVAAIALMPVALVQRYRVGTARRPARAWVVGLNLFAVSLSTAIFLAGAGVTAIWVPNAFTYSLMGLAAGCVLGTAGLALSRWEPGPQALHYTPNRPLVLTITLLVTARVVYGLWRGWQTWRAGVEGASLLVTAGVAGSLAAGAVVLGYYLIYWAGVRRRLRRYRLAR
ncbi:MAG TPA: hypothetical protein VD833_03385 [Vicinamibacterales bacterium]|nr:hypothetical protein [Vicinamibacterales bacterium]